MVNLVNHKPSFASVSVWWTAVALLATTIVPAKAADPGLVERQWRIDGAERKALIM